jgi:hypothetical protein
VRWLFLILAAISESAPSFLTIHEDFIESIFQSCEMTYYCMYIRVLGEQSAILMLICPTEKFYAAYSPKGLNKLNFAISQ